MIQIKRPKAVILVLLAVVLPSVFSVMNIPIEVNPSEDSLTLNISTSWTGASPELVAQEVTSLLEEQVSQVSYVQDIKSTSSKGNSLITVEFSDNADIEFVRMELKERLRSIINELPEECGRPQIQRYRPRNRSRNSRTDTFMSVTVIGDYSLAEIRNIVTENIKNPLLAIEGVSDVDVLGGREEEVLIKLHKNVLQQLDISIGTIAREISSTNKIRTLGLIRSGDDELFIQEGNKLTKLSDLENLEIPFGDGNRIKLGEISDISLHGKKVYSLSRTNGKPEVSIRISRDSQSNAVKLSGEIKTRLDAILSNLPYKLDYFIPIDSGADMLQEIRKLGERILLIIAIVVILLLLLMRDTKSFFILILSVLLTEAITLNFLYFTDVSVNFITLAALAIGLGIVIDNSIVVLENIYQKMEKGEERIKAIKEGTLEMIRPVLASTSTTLAVFIPFVLFSGRLKEYYLPLALAMIYSLISSILVSFTFIPAVSTLFLRIKKIKRIKKSVRFYQKIMAWTLKYSYIVVILILLIGYYSFKEFETVDRGGWFSMQSDEPLRISINLPEGSEISRADEIARKFEKVLNGAQGVKTVSTSVDSENAYVQALFTDEALNSALPYQYREDVNNLALQHAGVHIWVSGFGDSLSAGGFMRGSSGGSSRLTIKGYNLTELREIADNISKRILKNLRVREVNATTGQYRYYGSIDELVMKLDMARICSEGITPNEIVSNISIFLQNSQPCSSMRMGEKNYDITIEESFSGARQLEDLENKKDVFSDKGIRQLGNFFTPTWRQQSESIYRENQQYQMTLGWEFRGPYKAGERYFDNIYNSIELPPGYTKSKDDRFMMTEEEEKEIGKVLLVSLLAIFMILASLYESFLQPFIIFLTIPLSLIGVFLIFSWTSGVFDSSAYIGVILLCGMVVNNPIIMIDRFNTLGAQYKSMDKILIEGATSRLRPIVLTTVTTVGGLLPLALFAERTRNDIWFSLSLAAIGGLLGSALFTITFIPILYRFIYRFKSILETKKKMYKKIWEIS
ncbi:MAG: efflux RND transporter permease subunit [Acidobacteria bacterium]|nr:efflux RND transporter permease subunit [Acidobacteriota bacterium]